MVTTEYEGLTGGGACDRDFHEANTSGKAEEENGIETRG